MTNADYTPFLRRHRHQQAAHQLGEVPPCVYAKPVQDYFHNDTVKTALHIPDNAPVWDYCQSPINYTSGVNASQDIYVALRGKYQILKYSGDADGSVPTWGTQQWINELGWDILEEWRPFTLGG